MASMSFGRGVGTLTSVRFYKMVALVVVGMATSTFATEWVQNNVIDLGIPLQNAVYSMAVVLAVRTVMSGRASLLVSAGAGIGVFVDAMDELSIPL